MTLVPKALTGVLSYVHKGTAFEERSLQTLRDNLSMSLQRVGGKSDGGIDLQGWWWLPHTLSHRPGKPAPSSGLASEQERVRFRVLGQCKAEKKKASPRYVREMEGVLHRFISTSTQQASQNALTARHEFLYPPDALSHHPTVALLISESPFTKSTLLRAQSSPIPFFLLHIPPIRSSTCEDQGDDAAIGSAFWNPALSSTQGLLGGQMEVRWERPMKGNTQGRPGLWCNGHRVDSWTPGGSTAADHDIGDTNHSAGFVE